MKLPRFILISPVLCLVMLGGMAVERSLRLKPQDAEPYHTAARNAIEHIPLTVTIDGQEWGAEKRELPRAAVDLLRPNAHAHLRLTQTSSIGRPASADLLIVQCRDSRDMTGHYPPICYRGNGYTMVSSERRGPITLSKGLPVVFTEYHFERDTSAGIDRLCIYNFFVIPGRGTAADMAQVNETAEDYQRQFFGAAQIQVLVPAELPRGERENILTGLINANEPLLATLADAGTEGPKP